MLHGGLEVGALEIRRSADGSTRLRGRFPYNSRAVLSDGGRNGGKPRKEQFASRAFAYNIDNNVPIHLLVGHSYDKPLASTDTDTLALKDGDDALTFDATVTPEIAATTYGADILKMITAGLAVGLSPGFRIPPPRAVPADQAEKVEQEAYNPSKNMYGALIRTIFAALLFELSIVTRPAYPDTKVEKHDDLGNTIDDQIAARSWELTEAGVAVPKPHALARWRL